MRDPPKITQKESKNLQAQESIQHNFTIMFKIYVLQNDEAK